jgi:cytochrome c oxidase assembly factor CtaG
MSFLINLLVLIGFAFIGLIFLWYIPRRNDESGGAGKIFIVMFIILLVLAFTVWWFLK